MEVSVVLYATLTAYHPRGEGNEPFSVTLAPGATVDDLVKELGIDTAEVKQVFIRHRSRPRNHPLDDGDRIALFPAVAGG